MNTTIQALQALYVKLGGELTDTYANIADGEQVGNYTTVPDMIQACTQKTGGGGGSSLSVLASHALTEDMHVQGEGVHQWVTGQSFPQIPENSELYFNSEGLPLTPVTVEGTTAYVFNVENLDHLTPLDDTKPIYIYAGIDNNAMILSTEDLTGTTVNILSTVVQPTPSGGENLFIHVHYDEQNEIYAITETAEEIEALAADAKTNDKPLYVNLEFDSATSVIILINTLSADSNGVSLSGMFFGDKETNNVYLRSIQITTNNGAGSCSVYSYTIAYS